MLPFIVIGLLTAILVASVVGLVLAARRDRRRRRLAPLLVEVADYSAGVLACPTCRGTSFQSPPPSDRSFFGIFLFFVVLGNLSSSGTEYAECVACTGLFRRGRVRQEITQPEAATASVP